MVSALLFSILSALPLCHGQEGPLGRFGSNSGRSPHTFSNTPPVQLWSSGLTGASPRLSHVATSAAGVVFASTTTTLSKLDSTNGSYLWNATTGSNGVGGVSMSPDNSTVYVCVDATIKAYASSNGAPLWTFTGCPSGALFGPTVGVNGVLFVNAASCGGSPSNGKAIAVSAAGTQLWATGLGWDAWQAPALSADETAVWAGQSSGMAYVLAAATGATIASFGASGNTQLSVCDPGGTNCYLYIDAAVKAYSQSTRGLLWSYASSPRCVVVAASGNVIVAHSAGIVLLNKATGAVMWTNAAFTTAVGLLLDNNGNGALYFLRQGGQALVALSASTGALLWNVPIASDASGYLGGSGWSGQLSVNSDGLLYFLGSNMAVFAFSKKCPAGYLCTTTSDPVMCPAGAFANVNGSSCTLCPAGTWSAAVGAASNATCLACTCGACAAGATSNPSCSRTPSPTLTPSSTRTATRSPSLTTSPTISPTPCYAPAGYFCAGGIQICPAGSYSTSTGSTSCQQCLGGHYCPAGSSSGARLNCGRGNYCPDGSGVPWTCPFQAPPFGGWGVLQVQGPAFLVETAQCLAHCFWNYTAGDGSLSRC